VSSPIPAEHERLASSRVVTNSDERVSVR
jgi:hypothetical protein